MVKLDGFVNIVSRVFSCFTANIELSKANRAVVEARAFTIKIMAAATK